MQRTLIVFSILAVAFICYTAGPVFALKGIVDAVSVRDPVALAERLDIPKIKRSLLDQVGRSYLRISDKDKGMSPLEIQIAVRAASVMASSRVDDLVRPEALIDMLSSASSQYANLQVGVPRLEAPNLRNFARFIASTEYSGRDFSVIVPFAADEAAGYRLSLRLENWRWKLVGIGLPEAVRLRIASEVGSREKS